MKGNLITNPQRILELVKEKKAIWCTWTTNGYRLPAAVIVNWQFYLVMRAINEGTLYEYIPKKKEKKMFHENVNQYPKLPLLKADKDFKGYEEIKKTDYGN